MHKGEAGFGRHALVLAAFVVITLAWVTFILSESGTLPSFGETYELETTVPSASLMTPGARVTVAGAEVGSVKKVERADEIGSGAKLTLEITDDRVTPVPRDSRVQIRTRSQVGENYVSIAIGRDRQTVPSGGSLGLEQADELVDVDQILSVLRGKTRERTRTLLREFGGALTGRGDELNSTIRGSAGVIHYGTEMMDVLYTRRRTVASLVDQLGRVMAALGDRGAAIDTIATQGVTSLRAIGDRDAALAETLRELPSTLDQVRRASSTLGDVSDRAAPVVANLAVATRELRPAIQDLAPAARDGRGVFRELGGAAPRLTRTLSSLNKLSKHLPQVMPPLRTAFCQLNPAMRYLKPYRRDFLELVFHLGSAGHSYDAIGHLLRLSPIVNENSLSGAPPEVLDASKVLLQSGAFLPQKVISLDPIMEVGEVGRTRASASDPKTPEEVAASGFKYPRVKKDC